ncbi:hypothetical protein RR48_08789 [Papilio machaon]|uniref:Uncharacterized protein n=1 Tax=Papilio machaon TaxID=76193 RepID=A0A194RHJ4_PAPMA|nr:hypothetical protein RR48_08789 [Papilio machaon]
MAAVTSRCDLFGRGSPHASGMWSRESTERRQPVYFFARSYLHTSRANVVTRCCHTAPHRAALSVVVGVGVLVRSGVPVCERPPAATRARFRERLTGRTGFVFMDGV